MKLSGIITVNFNVTDQPLITYSAFIKYLNGNTMGQSIKAHDSVRREALHNIFLESCMLMKLASLMKMCLNEI